MSLGSAAAKKLSLFLACHPRRKWHGRLYNITSDVQNQNKRKEPPSRTAPANKRPPQRQPRGSAMDDENVPPIKIDGSYKEGGGQILRNAITYAVLLQKSVTISNVRANRPKKPGVRPQHLAGMRLAVEIGNARGGNFGGGMLVGADIGAKTVSFVHRGRGSTDDGGGDGWDCHDDDAGHAETFVADTGTAGSIALLLQAAFLPALVEAMRHTRPKRPPTVPAVKVELRGGTNATGAPQIDYLTDVFAPFINSYFRQYDNVVKCEESVGKPLDIQIIKRGYYPRGGGVVHVNLNPPSSPKRHGNTTFPPIQLTTCRPIASLLIKAFHAGKCPAWVAEKMVSGAVMELKRAWRENSRFRKRFLNINGVEEKNKSPISATIDGAAIHIMRDSNCLGSGSGILIVAYPDRDSRQTLACPALASSGLGDPKVPPPQTGGDVAKELVECITSGGCVDRWMQDQIVPFVALAGGRSEVLVGELTLHTLTAMRMAEQMTGCTFEWDQLDRDSGYAEEGGSQHYGEKGRVLGRHIIRCQGIGFCYT